MSVAPSQSYFALGIIALKSVMQSVSAGAKMHTTVMCNIQTAIKREIQQFSSLGSSCSFCTRQQTPFVAATGSCQSKALICKQYLVELRGFCKKMLLKVFYIYNRPQVH